MRWSGLRLRSPPRPVLQPAGVQGDTHQAFAPWLERTFDVVLGTVLLVELVLLFGNTAMRALTNNSLVWANEVSEYALTALAFIGGAIAYHRGMHMVVRFAIDRLPRHLREYAECARHYFVLVVAGSASATPCRCGSAPGTT